MTGSSSERVTYAPGIRVAQVLAGSCCREAPRAASAWGVAVLTQRKLKERYTIGAAVRFCDPVRLGAHEGPITLAAVDH
jgi:hypothetical protein